MTKKEKIRGLRGWLILPIIGLFISLPILFYDIISALGFYRFDALIGFAIFLDFILIAFIIIALVAIFEKKRYVPKLMISFYIINLIIQLVASFWSEDYSRLGGVVIGSAIWIPYFIYSKRVKNTFVKK